MADDDKNKTGNNDQGSAGSNASAGTGQTDAGNQTNDESDWNRFERLIDEKTSAAVKREVGSAVGTAVKEALQGWQPSGHSGTDQGTTTNSQSEGQQTQQQGRRESQQRRPGFLERAMGWAEQATTKSQ